ncbi:hypothetical protein MJD09_03770 [bacterium]|nr:hypothetical protein [bacterium]
MTESEYRKELLLHKIDSHRRLFRVELDSVKTAVRPLNSIFSIGRQAANAASRVSAILKTDGDDSDDSGRWLNLETLLTIAVSFLASFLRAKTED